MTDSRFPRSVYGTGSEPDPRFSLANERTFLAWIRTALALVAVGVGVEALALPIHPVLRFIAAVAFVLLAVLAAVHAWLSWRSNERSMRLGRALSGQTVSLVLVIGVALATALIAVGMFL